MAFFLSAPRVFAAAIRSEYVLHLEFDRTQKYLAVLTPSSLSVWSGDADRVLLAQHRRDDVADRTQDGNVELIWNHGSTEIAVLTADGGINYYSLIKVPSYSLPALLSDAARGVGVSLQLRHRAWADDHFLASVTCDGRGIVCGTSDGQLVRISWAGVVASVLTVTDGAKYVVDVGSDWSSSSSGGVYSSKDTPVHQQAQFVATCHLPHTPPSAADARTAESAPTGASLLSAEEIKQIELKVRHFYMTHNPDKLRESPPDFVQTTLGVLILLYMCPHTTLCPHTIITCPHTTTLGKWRGKEHLLLASLHRKYSVSLHSRCPHTTISVPILL